MFCCSFAAMPWAWTRKKHTHNCNGRQTSKEFSIGDYIKRNAGGHFLARIDFVFPLAGGGTGTSEPGGSCKNQLASLLLSHGGEIGEIAKFVSSVGKAGPMALSSVLQQKDPNDKLPALKKLAECLNLQLSDLDVRQPILRRRIQRQVTNEASLDLSLIRLKDDFFLNEDGSQCAQRSCPSSGEAGICLISAGDSEQWLHSTISADEQAMLIIGSRRDASKKGCRMISVPAFMQTSSGKGRTNYH